MQLPRKKAVIVQKAIVYWEQQRLISPETAASLRADIQVMPFDWKRLAKYSFWIAIISLVIAVGSILADHELLEMLLAIFQTPPLAKSLFFVALSAGLLWLGWRRRKIHPEKTFSNEALFFLGVLGIAGSIAFFGQAIDTGSGHFSLLLLLACGVYGALGMTLDSKLIWIFALLSLGGWLGAETGYMSGWGAYYLGMNFPLRFIFFGLALTGLSFLFLRAPKLRHFFEPSRTMGLLYLFVALWIMSIFGNYGDMDSWYHARQYELFYWAILFGLASAASIYFGLKTDDSVFRGFGIVFLFINVYTRFFEYFWDSVHKAIFFAILAVSFWTLGARAETVWSLGGRAKKRQVQKQS